MLVLAPPRFKPAVVLAAVKDKPFGRPANRAFLDCHSTRRRRLHVGRDGKAGSAGGRTKKPIPQGSRRH